MDLDDLFNDPTDSPVGTSGKLPEKTHDQKMGTVAPTNQATLDQVVQKRSGPQLTPDQLDFVTLLHQHWELYGELLGSERGEELYKVPARTFTKHLSTEAVQEALGERGVNLRSIQVDSSNPSEAWRSSSLTPLQLVVANTMLDILDTRSDKKKLADMGVDTKKWNAWLRDPGFYSYIRNRAEGLLSNSHHEALLALTDRVRSGDLGAIKLHLEMTNRFVPKTDTNGISVDEVKNLITQMIEIVIDTVTNPAEAQEIAERMKGLIGARNTAHALVTGDVEDGIIIPTVAANRVITPELQSLMDAGVGMDT